MQPRNGRSQFDRLREGLQPIAEIAQPFRATVEIEEPGCLAHRIASKPTETIESENGKFRQCFRAVQLHREVRIRMVEGIRMPPSQMHSVEFTYALAKAMAPLSTRRRVLVSGVA